MGLVDRRPGGGIARASIAAALALLASAAAADAAVPPRTPRLVSPGAADLDAAALAIAADGSRIVFQTEESLVAGDQPGTLDLYARDADGTLQRLTFSGWVAAGTCAVSADGTYAWFVTPRSELPEDVDAAADVYEVARDGSRRLLSAGTSNASFAGATADGGHVLFATGQPLTGTGDVDLARDLFDRRRDGSFRLVTTGTATDVTVPPGGAVAPLATAVRFETDEALVAADVDGAADLYAAPLAGGPYRILSAPTATETARWATDDAGTVTLATTARLMARDTDDAEDVYLRRPDGSVELVSPGGLDLPASPRLASRDGARVLFTTAEPLVAEDTDADTDFYVWSADAPLRVVAPAVPVGVMGLPVWLGDDGTIAFVTPGPVLPMDVDMAEDLYIADPDGALHLLTPATTADAYQTVFIFPRSSARFVIDLDVDLAGDANGLSDAYELGPDGQVRLLVSGLGGGSTTTRLQAADGSRLLLLTGATVPGTGDVDNAVDVYAADVAPPSLAGAPTLAGPGRVDATLACAAPAVTGELVTLSRAWLRDGAPIAGATGSERVAARADAGHDLACRVTATNPLGAAARTSAARRIAPAARAAALAGVPVVGTRLVCTAFDGATSVAYRWTRAGRVVVGRTGPRYRVGAADLGRRVACRATARSGQATTVVVLGRVVPRRCAVPSLRGALPGVAVARLGAAGCRSRVVRRSGKGVPVGRVLGTTPRAGVRRANGAVIVVRVRR